MKAKFLFTGLLVMVLVLSVGSLALAQTYTVGTSADFPPFEYVEDEEIVGFDIELIKTIAEDQGFEVEIKDMSFDSLPAALKTGNVDIVASGFTITEERKKAFDFSDPYYSADQSIIVKEGSDKNLTVLYGDNDIGVQTGTTGDMWVTENLAEADILTGEVVRFDTFVMVINDLINENLDGVVLDSPVAERFEEEEDVKVIGEIITGEEYGIAVQQGNQELLDKINNGLEALKESGKYDELLVKYFE